MNDRERDREHDRERAPAQWEVLQTFTATVGRTPIAVQVRRDVSVPWPKLHYAIGRFNGERVQPFLPVETEREEDNSRRQVMFQSALFDLLRQAEDRAAEEIRRSNEYYASRSRRNGGDSYPASGNGGNNRGPRGGGFGDAPRSPMRVGKTSRDRSRHTRQHDD